MRTVIETLDRDFQRILGPLAEEKFRREEQGFTDVMGRQVPAKSESERGQLGSNNTSNTQG